MVKAIIFDLDGVLVHTDKFHYLAWQTLADEEGIYFDKVINKRLLGIARMESLGIILEKSAQIYSDAEKLKLTERKNDYYLKLLSTLTPQHLDKEVELTLLTLKDKGYYLAVGSSSKNAKRILTLLGIEHLFDVISDGNELVNAKPHPEVFLKVAHILKVKPRECLIVEDADAGIKAAIAGGFKVVGIGQASNNKEADFTITKLSDLLKLVI